MIDNDIVRYAVYDTGVGNVTVIARGRKLVTLLFGAYDPDGARNEENSALYDAIIELNQYCYGQRKNFDLRLKYEGSEEETKVWEYCLSLPYGTTKTLLEASREIGLKESIVSFCLLRNPLPIFIPTHRIVSSKNEPVAYPNESSEIGNKLLAIERGEGKRIFTSKNALPIDED